MNRSMVILAGHPRQRRRTVYLKDGGQPIAYAQKTSRGEKYEWKLLGFNEKWHANATSWSNAVERILIELNGGHR